MVLCLLIFAGSFSQVKDADLINFTQQDGLPSNEAYCVFKDSKNFIWISTDQGVVRFNGITMEKFELPDNVVFKIKEDAKGRVWFFSHTGKLAYFKNEKMYPYEYNDSIIKNIKNLLLTDAYITSQDEILLNSVIEPNYKILKAGTIIELKQTAQNALLINITKQRGRDLFTQLNSFALYTEINTLVITRNDNRQLTYTIPMKLTKAYAHCGSVYGNKGTVFSFFGNLLLRLNSDGSYLCKEIPSTIFTMYRDSLSGKLFLGLLKGGVYIADSALNKIDNSCLSGKTVTSITSDSEGDIWFTTLESGIYYSNAGNTVKRYFQKLTDTETQRLYNYKDTILVTGNSNRLQLIEGKKVLTLFDYKNTEIGDVFISRGGTVFSVGHFYSRNKFITTKSSNPVFKKIFTIDAGHETISLDGNIQLLNISNAVLSINLAKLLQKGNIPTDSASNVGVNDFTIQCMFKKDADNILLGSIKNLHLYTISKKTIRPYKEAASVFNSGVGCIRQLFNGIFTIGIRSGGIALMRDTTVIAQITEADGLLSNTIKYLLPVDNRLWVATPKGISAITFSSYDPVRYSIKNFGENAGMYDQIIYQLIAFKGNVLAASSRGIYEISNIEKLLTEKPLPIPLYITSVKYLDIDTSGVNTITVPYSKSRVSVEFNAICINSPKEMQYFYRLGNKDTTWYSIINTEVILQNLAPGDYELEIKATVPKQNRVSDIKKLVIHVAKPWWLRNSIIVICILLFLGAVYSFYKWRIYKIKKEEVEKTQIKIQMTDLEQTALRLQMNPHFIFNCLTSIQQLVNLGSREDANEYLVKFARLIRKTLELSAKPNMVLFDEIAYLKDYMELEQLRIPGQFEFNFIIDERVDAGKIEIPNMMIQPFIENAIRHGIKHLENMKGRIDIEISSTPGYIHCIITDNGVGRKEALKNNSMAYSDHKSFGIDIVKQRLADLAKIKKENYFLNITDLYTDEGEAAGTKVVLQLPFKISL